MVCLSLYCAVSLIRTCCRAGGVTRRGRVSVCSTQYVSPYLYITLLCLLHACATCPLLPTIYPSFCSKGGQAWEKERDPPSNMSWRRMDGTDILDVLLLAPSLSQQWRHVLTFYYPHTYIFVLVDGGHESLNCCAQRQTWCVMVCEKGEGGGEGIGEERGLGHFCVGVWSQGQTDSCS